MLILIYRKDPYGPGEYMRGADHGKTTNNKVK